MGEKLIVATHPMRHVLEWFYDLILPGGYGWGPFKISYLEIEAFSRQRHLDVRPWEAELIVDLSIKYVEVHNHKQAVKAGLPSGYKPVNMRDTNAVKAMFAGVGEKKRTK